MLAVKSKPSSLAPMGTSEFDTVTGAQVFEYIWVIDDANNLTETYEEDDRLSSPRFYIGPRSYRMFMSTYPVGQSSRPAAYLDWVNIYGGVARGAYDDVLTWPFSLRFDLILLDQTEVNPQNIETTTWPGISCDDEDLWDETLIDRYQGWEPWGCGNPLLVEKAELTKRNYIKDDKMMFKMKVFFN